LRAKLTRSGGNHNFHGQSSIPDYRKLETNNDFAFGVAVWVDMIADMIAG
jgi:hypothetical protein